jgi:glycosyltransferase involved in cell wall biosynthesis
MYHADLLGGLAAREAGNIPVVWGLHHTLGNRQAVRPLTRGVIWINALLSNMLPRKVICCAESVRASHSKVGYSAKKMIVIPNGIDVQKFHPLPEAHQEVRKDLGLAPGTPLIGLFARFHPQKDHETFFRAACLLHERLPEVHFILAGERMDSSNEKLCTRLAASGVADQVHLLGLRQDMPWLMAAMDLSCSSSAYGEALSLALLESMACGIPCVATDVGDARLLVGSTGRIVPTQDAEALADQLEALLRLPGREREKLGQAARDKIQNEYNILHSAREYDSLYASLIADR